MKLDPIYKWAGGKRKEIRVFSKLYPDFVKEDGDYKYVEPFFGGGAVYWSLDPKESVINDIDVELVNFLRVLSKDPDSLLGITKEVSERISQISKKEKENEISALEAKIQRGSLVLRLAQ